MAQLMPLPLTVSCFSKIQIGFTFLVPAHLGSPDKGPLNGCVVYLWFYLTTRIMLSPPQIIAPSSSSPHFSCCSYHNSWPQCMRHKYRCRLHISRTSLSFVLPDSCADSTEILTSINYKTCFTFLTSMGL